MRKSTKTFSTPTKSVEEFSGSAPTMSRSRGQIASAYAPLRHFAFENGLGICITSPVPTTRLDVPAQTRRQILLRLNETTRTWYELASHNAAPPIDAVARNPRLALCIDRALFDEVENAYRFQPDAFALVRPDAMGYEPSPTTLYCGKCGLIRPCNNTREMSRFLSDASSGCPDPSKPTQRRAIDCIWSQFEVIFVHHSGDWSPVGTDITDYDAATRRVYKRTTSCTSCGSTDFRVDTTAIDLSGWFLKCARCNSRSNNPWIDHDPETLRAIGPLIGKGTTLIEARMQKINYAASAAYHVHGETFIDFPESDLLESLEGTDSARQDLCRRVAQRCGYTGGRPEPEEALAQLRQTKNQNWIAELEDAIASYSQATSYSLEKLMQQTKRSLDRIIDRHIEGGVIEVAETLPSKLRERIAIRSDSWSSRYDPFRLLVEHEALTQTKLTGVVEGTRRSFVPFDDPDEWIAPDASDLPSVNQRTRSLLGRVGVARAGIISKFNLCRFTFGFSRMQSRPWMRRNNVDVPVRLRLFPTTSIAGERRHPVYVLTQSNEAYYFRLDEGGVRAWLHALDCVDDAYLNSEPTLAGALLMSAEPRDRFLTAHDSPQPAQLYDAAYGLLHSFAHHVMRGIATFSGLDLGSLGEYLFPVDLSFAVYRTGMTMDLGNLSALWRNSWLQFLEHLARYTWTLGCNLGALCVRQGGACPDCFMIPEISCIAGNKYLSRSLLIGNGHPQFIATDSNVRGFLPSMGNTAQLNVEASD